MKNETSSTTVSIKKLEEIASTIEGWGWESSDSGHAMAQGAARLIRDAIAAARPSGEPGGTQWKAGYMARLNEEMAKRPEPKHPTLWRYLDNAHKAKITFHRIGVNRQPDGGYHFYIHPEGVSGDTQDYLLWPDPFTWEDMLVNRLDSPPPDSEGFKRSLAAAMRQSQPEERK